MVGDDAREVVNRISTSLPLDNPITGEVFENTVLLLKCVDQPIAGASNSRAAGTGSRGSRSGMPGFETGPALNA